jgi:hypothetical protein
LSNTSVQFSVAVLARLSKAGIDGLTLQIGRAICCNFALEPHAQERICEAISKLKKYGSYKNLIWFGFGIKDVVTDLADTEEGLTLVALCAALSTTYDSTFAARVIRELCVLCKAPQPFTPAFHQWKSLVDLCTGMLTSAHFVVIANGFRRLISGHASHIAERHTPTTHTALADAILTLARISKRNLISATFSGGVDCAWLAAFAEWILLLDVGLCDSNGNFLYRSRGRADSVPQVTIILPTTTTRLRQEILLKSKAFLLPSGQTLLQKDPALRGVDVLNWQGSWPTILHDVFRGHIDKALSGQTGHYFAMYMTCVSLLPMPARKDNRHGYGQRPDFVNHPVNPLIWAQRNAVGPQFINFAARRLPELAMCLSDKPVIVSEESLDEQGHLAVSSIEAVCSCPYHMPNGKGLEGDDQVCLRTMLETITIFLWILVNCDIDEDVPPSITGLINLYAWQSHANKSSSSVSRTFYNSILGCDFPVLGIDMVFHVLSGVSVSGTPPNHESLPTTDRLARVGNGICVYHYAVEDPNLPPESIFRSRVVQGYISCSGLRYKELCGVEGAYVDGDIQLSDICHEPATRSVQAMVQETSDDTRLEMAYLVEYVNKVGIHCTHRLHLPFLFRKLQRKLMYWSCPGNCPSLNDLHTWTDHPGKYPNKQMRISRKADEKSVQEARKMFNNLKNAANTWIIIRSPGVYSIVIDRPFLLYTLVSQSSNCVMPFKNCLACIMRVGESMFTYPLLHEVGSEERTEVDGILYRGTTTIETSDNEMVIIPWNEYEPIELD